MNRRVITALAMAVLPILPAACVSIPENLQAPANQMLSLKTQATGVQIYQCNPSKTDSGRFEWVFMAPEAELVDLAGKRIAKHYAGPTWESTIDGSKVIGEVKARSDSPDPSAIPWLLLTAKSTSGDGIFSRTLSIQRLQTVGGKAPGANCNPEQNGTEARVAYQASYYFYVAKP